MHNAHTCAQRSTHTVGKTPVWVFGEFERGPARERVVYIGTYICNGKRVSISLVYIHTHSPAILLYTVRAHLMKQKLDQRSRTCPGAIYSSTLFNYACYALHTHTPPMQISLLSLSLTLRALLKLFVSLIFFPPPIKFYLIVSRKLDNVPAV